MDTFEPTYQGKDIPFLIKKICKDEYSLDVTTKRSHNTLWIYAPVSQILDKDYGIKEDKFFDEDLMNKLRNILTTVGRVLISSDNTPDFFALLASDINNGIDYTIIGNAVDIKKSYAGFIPWTEANRRYVVKLNLAPEAVNDTTGKHLQVYDIKLSDFLAEQIAQRIIAHFQDEQWKQYFKVEKSEGRFSNNTFILEYSVKEISKPKQKIDIKKEVLNIMSYCIKTYEFKDFSLIEVTDLATGEKTVLNKAAIGEKLTE